MLFENCFKLRDELVLPTRREMCWTNILAIITKQQGDVV
jgi:hypothetical protein